MYKIEKELDEYENLPRKSKKNMLFFNYEKRASFYCTTLFIFNFIILALLDKDIANEYLGGFIIFNY